MTTTSRGWPRATRNRILDVRATAAAIRSTMSSTAVPRASASRQTLTERRPMVMALVTLLVVVAVGAACGTAVAWLLVGALHHAGLSNAVVGR